MDMTMTIMLEVTAAFISGTFSERMKNLKMALVWVLFKRRLWKSTW